MKYLTTCQSKVKAVGALRANILAALPLYWPVIV
jgi:hypothetical protein